MDAACKNLPPTPQKTQSDGKEQIATTDLGSPLTPLKSLNYYVMVRISVMLFLEIKV